MRLINDDCIQAIETLDASSVDLICTDLPYGTTYCKWDSIIPLDQMWKAFARVLKPGGAIVLTASQPFTSVLIASKLDWFRTEWIWDKENSTNFANAKRHPMKVHESVLVFGPKATRYFPIRVPGKLNHKQGSSLTKYSESMLINKRNADDLSGLKYPKSIQSFPKHSSQLGLHPTQKPVDLIEYFIRTYSLEGEVVLDCCMGSGTAGVACVNTGRQFVGIEKDTDYFMLAQNRIDQSVESKKESLI